ncbi:hypothetical protein EC973_000434 [Apophysomyces ossiformis]|uniref:RNB domain-containing protein n=1 Tax=Apophysomyces ossiformis TaxID=679940 RepID=A0A8H7BL79_9FUNG|nr:hypothetical protein EC973_000434 [Apophysomyces ossiformis]
MDILGLDGQTAPESTRGLFDPPERKVDQQRHSAQEFSDNHPAKIRQRSNSDYTPLSSMNNNNNNSIHHHNNTINNNSGRHRSALPIVCEEGDLRTEAQRTRASIANFNNFPMGQTNFRRSSALEYSQKLRSAFSEEKTMMTEPLHEDVDDEDENESYNRAEDLAATEAKLTGGYRGQKVQEDRTRSYASYAAASLDQKRNRRLSEPNGRPCHRYSDNQDFSRRSLNYSNTSRRISLHWPENDYNNNNNNNNSNDAHDSPPTQRGRPPSLNLDMNKTNRRSFSRNPGDWRSSMTATSTTNARSPPPLLPSGATRRTPISGLVPFTPTQVNFSREDNHPGQQSQRRALFTAHLPFSGVIPYLKSHQLVSGLLRVNKRNRSDAYVFCEEFNADIYICGSRDRNRALEGDTVAVKLVEVEKVMREKLEKEDAKLARNNGQPVIRKPDEEDEKEIMFGGEDDVDKVKPRYCGVVVAILERAQNQVFSGTLGLMRPSNKRMKKDGTEDFQSKDNAPRIVWFKPTDKRVPLIAIPVEQAPEGFLENYKQFEKRLFLGSIKRWPITSLHPFGVLEGEVGPVSDIKVQFKAILADNNFPSQDFSEQVTRCLPQLPWTPTEEAVAIRRDLRSIRCITLDAAADGDQDNAMSIQKLSENAFEVGFHVADISAFVKLHSPMDKEARARAIGIHLHETVPLWPTQLLQEVTNLSPGVDRYSFSVIWKLSQAGDVLDVWYGKTMIRSHGVLSAAEVQKVLDGRDLPSHLQIKESEKPKWEEDLRMLHTLAQNLKQTRLRNGALMLTEMELNVQLVDDKPVQIATKERMLAEDLLEEFKILANTGVAHKISSHFPEHALLQSQSPPNERKLLELAQYLQRVGYSIDPSSTGRLQASIDAIENPDARSVITTLVLRTMSARKYFCAGAFDINRYFHYSLNVPLYTHFTSPSRRYADLIVHRQLETALAGGVFHMEPEVIQKYAQHCNVKGQGAMNAREQTQHLFLSTFLAASGQATTTHEAIVVGVQAQAFDVVVPTVGLERRIHVINLPLNTSKYDSAAGLLHLHWKPGVATADAIVEQSFDTDTEDDDMGDLDCLSETVSQLSIQSPTAKRRPRSMSLRVVEGENPWISQQECTNPGECCQVIRPFDYVRVVVTADPIRNPPLIRILAANPFV